MNGAQSPHPSKRIVRAADHTAGWHGSAAAEFQDGALLPLGGDRMSSAGTLKRFDDAAEEAGAGDISRFPPPGFRIARCDDSPE
jgi:hypothetical protein